MKTKLSFTEIQQAIADLQDDLYSQLKLEANEALLKFPAFLGRGYLRGIRLREGLDLHVQEYVLKTDLLLHAQNFSLETTCASLTFCLSGRFRSTFPSVSSEITMQSRGAAFYTSPYAAGTLEFKAGEHIHFVEITIKPTLILSLIGQELAELPQNLQQAIQSGASEHAIHLCDTSAEMTHVLHKIIHCPYHGQIRDVYLEGKVLELIALYFSQFCPFSSPLSVQSSALLKPKEHQEIERLYESREILKENLMTPPTLAELSKRVGLSERQLQKGFQELFGTTVFAVLHHDRMEYARQLLETGQISVGAIADMVGISHRGYFAQAFKRKFGRTPKEYMKQFGKT